MKETYAGHSAEVKIHVVRNGSSFSVAQLGPDFLILEDTHVIEGQAEIILCVDGVTRSRPVQLHSGTGSSEKTIRLSRVRD